MKETRISSAAYKINSAPFRPSPAAETRSPIFTASIINRPFSAVTPREGASFKAPKIHRIESVLGRPIGAPPRQSPESRVPTRFLSTIPKSPTPRIAEPKVQNTPSTHRRIPEMRRKAHAYAAGRPKPEGTSVKAFREAALPITPGIIEQKPIFSRPISTTRPGLYRGPETYKKMRPVQELQNPLRPLHVQATPQPTIHHPWTERISRRLPAHRLVQRIETRRAPQVQERVNKVIPLKTTEAQKMFRKQLVTPEGQKQLQTVRAIRHILRQYPKERTQARETYKAWVALAETNPAYTKQKALSTVLKTLEQKYPHAMLKPQPQTAPQAGGKMQRPSLSGQVGIAAKGETRLRQPTPLKKQEEAKPKIMVDDLVQERRFIAIGYLWEAWKKRQSRANQQKPITGSQAANGLIREYHADPRQKSRMPEILHDGGQERIVRTVEKMPTVGLLTMQAVLLDNPPIRRADQGQPASIPQIENVMRQTPLPPEKTIYSYT